MASLMLLRRFSTNVKRVKIVRDPNVVGQPEDLQLHDSPVMAKISSERYQKVVKCGVPKHRFNDFLTMYVRELYNVNALDENEICKPGDWVLLRKKELPDKAVTHIVDRIVYSHGNYIDPLTNKRSFGIYFDEDLQRLEKIKVEI